MSKQEWLYDQLQKEVPEAPFWEKFHETYKPVEMVLNSQSDHPPVEVSCDRCYARVRNLDWTKHVDWHRDITLGMFIHSSWISEIMKAWEGEDAN